MFKLLNVETTLKEPFRFLSNFLILRFFGWSFVKKWPIIARPLPDKSSDQFHLVLLYDFGHTTNINFD